MIAAEEVADVSDRRAQRTGVTYGNMCAKLSDYIGQIFECKADRPHYSCRFVQAGGVAAAGHEKQDSGDGRDGRRFEVRNARFSELRTPNFESRLSRTSTSQFTLMSNAD